jgi:hypothetical protein
MLIFVAKDTDFPVYATRTYRDRRTALLILNLGTWIQQWFLLENDLDGLKRVQCNKINC